MVPSGHRVPEGGPHAAIRRDQDPRLHPRAGRAVRRLPAGRPRRRRRQGGRPERARPEPGVGGRPRAEQGDDGHRLPHPGVEQARDRAEPQDGGGPGGAQAPGRRLGRRPGRELPARRLRRARPRLRGPGPPQADAHLRLHDRLRPRRPPRHPDRLRPRHPGHLGHHRLDRHRGQRPHQDRGADGRLRDGHDGRLRHLGRALPADAHRPGPAHRHGDARRRHDPAGLAHHRLPALRPSSPAQRQRHALRLDVGVSRPKTVWSSWRPATRASTAVSTRRSAIRTRPSARAWRSATTATPRSWPPSPRR